MAGADVVFVESPETAAEMRAVCRAILAPCLANMVEGGLVKAAPSRQKSRDLGVALGNGSEVHLEFRHLTTCPSVYNLPVGYI